MPSVPRRETSPPAALGAYSETPVCEPIENVANEAATDAPEPPDEPCEVEDGWIAFHTWPHGLSEWRPEFANSDMFVLPITIAPAARSFATWNASLGGR